MLKSPNLRNGNQEILHNTTKQNMSAYVKQIFRKNDGGGADPYREDVLHICIKF